MKLTVHRGTREIGGTCIEIRSAKTRIILDYGLPLDEEFGRKLARLIERGDSIGDLIRKGFLCDVPGLHRGQPAGVDAVLVSHSHRDHYGMLRFVHPGIPVHMNGAALKVIQVLAAVTRSHETPAAWHDLRAGGVLRIGDLKVTPYLVDHSAFNSMSFLVEEAATGKRLFYTGDLRAGGWKRDRFERFVADPPRAVDCLVMEGTLAGRRSGRYADEPAVMDAVREELRRSAGNTVLAYCSGQNIDRLVTLYKAARREGALLVVDPYTAVVLEAARSGSHRIPGIRWDGIKVWVGDYYGSGDKYINRIARSDFRSLIPAMGAIKIKAFEIGRQKALVLMRDSMIELAERIPGLDGSTLIFSMWDGYLRDESKSREMAGFVAGHRLKVRRIHASGHATVEQLRRLVAALSPGMIVPVHTRRPDLISRAFGKTVVRTKDGQEIGI